jgi:outer membrane protein assembly factor BamA
MRKTFLLFLPLALFFLVACNTMKYVPKDEYLLQKVRIISEKGLMNSSELSIYLHQVPNERFLNFLNMNLFFYNLSGADTSKWVNRMFRKLGEAPVIYDAGKNERSRITIENLMVNKGYFNADVQKDVKFRKRKAYVTLKVKGNTPYTIKHYDFIPTKDSISLLIQKAVQSSPIRPGILLSSEKLDEERTRLVHLLQQKGYYALQKDYFSFNVDTTLGTNQANVSLVLKSYLPDTTVTKIPQKELLNFSHPVYRIRNVYFMLDVPMSNFTRNPSSESGNTGEAVFSVADFDTLTNGAYRTVYRGKPFIAPEALIKNCRIVPGELYDMKTVERTYSRLSSLQYMKYINIRFSDGRADTSSEHPLDCYIVLTQNLKQGIGFDLEGTNTAGDFGVAGNMNYTHRNLLNGSELFEVKVRGAYEALTSFQNDYTELGGELNLTLPEFRMPFLSAQFKQGVDATTEFTTSYQLMSRPEFERTVASMGVSYNWSRNNLRQTIDLFDLSYVYMPWVDSTFQADYLTNTSYLKYSYEDHFILRTAYSFSYSSAPFGTTSRTYHTWKGSFEAAGNALYAIYTLAGAKKDDGIYKIGNIGFSQYVKGEMEYVKNLTLTSRSRIAYRAGIGLAYPYGNSTILPFEKRFYSGGANSVRGWSVRTLGPGSYDSGSSTIDFMNQSGDMKLDLSMEYRGMLFWVLEGALFADAGNIWTLREYSGQPGGQFRFDSFYKQLAGSVGAGVRLVFPYFLIRVDCGMKVYDPSSTLTDHWRIRSIDNWDDFALHFAVGYPF